MDKVAITKEQKDEISKRLNGHERCVFAIKNIFKKCVKPGFAFLKIVQCNANLSCPFSSATCKTQKNYTDKDVDLDDIFHISFGQFFRFTLLHDVIEGADGVENKLSKKQLLALEKLADFLDNQTGHAEKLWKTSHVNDLKEDDWTKIISAHLVSKLAVSKNITLDEGYLTKSSGKFCPCDCGTELVFKDNSMGHEDVWHGSVDILVGRSAVVTASVVGNEDASASGDACLSDSSDSKDGMTALEMKVAKSSFDQVLAESIVFSLAQRDSDLAPTVLINKTEMVVYIYEKKHDILLESYPIGIFSKTTNSLCPLFVLSLWLTLNYRHFCDDAMFFKMQPHRCIHYRAGFFEEVPKRKHDIYKHHLRFTGCRHVKNTEEPRYDEVKSYFSYKFPHKLDPDAASSDVECPDEECPDGGT